MKQIAHVKNSLFFFTAILCIVKVSSSCSSTPLKSTIISTDYDDCGVIEPSDDLRTRTPWTAAIFFRSKSASYTYHATGAILSPTTILTVFAGVHGKLPRKIRGKYSMHNPELTLVGAGLVTDNLTQADEYSQFAEVSFVEPYMGPAEPNREYHFVLLHLKTPFDFSTPYVRPICLRYSATTPTATSHRKVNDTIYLHGGFARRKIKQGSVTEWATELKIQSVTTGTGYECVKNFEHFYERHFPPGMFCAKTLLDNRATDKSFSCMLHGSSVSEKIADRWTISGLTALIRGRKAGLCKHDSVYFNTKLASSLDWIQRSLRCSPFSFSCTDGTCIPLEDVCNSVRNCMDGSDEKEVFCESNNRCNSQSQSHLCSLVGKCISKDELCDGKADCKEGTDESPLLCDKDLSNRNLRDLIPSVAVKTYCLPIPESEGVKIEYSHHNPKVIVNCTMIPVSTIATLSCRNYYKPKFLYSHLELQCNDHGKWSSYSPFICEPDCGMINQKQPQIRTGATEQEITVHSDGLLHLQYTIPWHILLFRQDEKNNFHFVCGGSLIEQSYIISSANCVSEQDGSVTSTRILKIVVAPLSKNFSNNLQNIDTGPSSPQIISVENIWRHDSFDETTKQFNIAILKIEKRIQYTAFVRPVCYLPAAAPSQAFQFQTRISAKFMGHDSGGLVGLHISDFPQIAEMACITTESSISQRRNSLATKCAGQINGTVVHQKDGGGGLVYLGKTNFGSRYILQGVMSFEEQRGAEKISFFTTLQRTKDWILNIVNKQYSYNGII